MNQIKLTDEQVASMKTDHPWLKATKDQEHFILDCPAGHRVMLYDDAFIHVPEARVEAVTRTAFEDGVVGALRSLGITQREQISNIDFEPLELGQNYIRVVVKAVDGREASAIGMIPDPRAH